MNSNPRPNLELATPWALSGRALRPMKAARVLAIITDRADAELTRTREDS